MADHPHAVQIAFSRPVAKAWSGLRQERANNEKLHSWHAPAVEVIGQGKVARRWDFGVTATVAVVNEDRLSFGHCPLPGNPYKGAQVTGRPGADLARLNWTHSCGQFSENGLWMKA